MEVMCCVCNRIKNQSGWCLETYQGNEDISHGYCPDCGEKLLAKLRRITHAVKVRTSPVVIKADQTDYA